MTYKSVVVTKRGGVEAVQVVDKDLHSLSESEARIRVIATPVCQDDIAIRQGNRPFLAKLPFVPGYAFIGVVDAIGEGVTCVAVGDRVAALTQYGSHAEFIYWEANELVHVPASLDPAMAAPLILNYLVAYQILFRVAQVKAGDKVLIIGASGGVGTAFMQLGKLAELKMYGLASPRKHPTLMEYGVTPIDYHTQDFAEVIRKAEPEGIDYVFNGMGEETYERSLSILRRGGVLVHYGAPQGFGHFLLLVAKLLFYNALPNGKKIEGYGTHRLGVDLFKEDWQKLFELLQEGKIHPVIEKKLPLMEAVNAYQLLASGSVTGNLVLMAPEWLPDDENG